MMVLNLFLKLIYLLLHVAIRMCSGKSFVQLSIIIVNCCVLCPNMCVLIIRY